VWWVGSLSGNVENAVLVVAIGKGFYESPRQQAKPFLCREDLVWISPILMADCDTGAPVCSFVDAV